MRTDPERLVRRLTPAATRHLEAAVGHAVSSQHGSVGAEHLLRSILEPEDSEAAMLLAEMRRDRRRLVDQVDGQLREMPIAPGARPVLSESLLGWLEDAWLLASLEWGESRLRTGALLVQWIRRPGRYAAGRLAELEGVSGDALVREAPGVLRGSTEDEQAVDRDGGPRADAPAQPAADGALARYGEDFTEKARAGRIDPVFGREREIRQALDVLCRRRKNNVVLLGEPGVGKTALVEGLALAIAEGQVPEALRDVRLVELDLGLLQAGASVRGELEKRLKAVIDEVQASPRPVILFIDEAHMLLGGGQQGGGEAANLLKPALARGELRTIAATTWREYKKYFEKDAALERRFQVVKVDEPTEEQAVRILRGLRPVYEKAHGVIIREEAVVAAARLSSRYISGRQLPDKAVDLLDTTAARVRVDQSSLPQRLVEIDAQLRALSHERDSVARDLSDGEAAEVLVETLDRTHREIHELEGRRQQLASRWGLQRETLDRLLATRRRIATCGEALEGGDTQVADELEELSAEARAIAAELRELGGEELLVGVEVDADAVARTVSAWTGIPAGRLHQDAASVMLSLEERLGERIVGQPEAVGAVAEALRVAHTGLGVPESPLAVLLFVGPSGVGKTELARVVAEEMFGGERFLTRIHMTEFQEKHTVSRLIGSPPGYVGYGEGGVLTEAVRQKPYSVVLLDECEKADLEVMNLFYQVFDKGILSDGEGRPISFRNTVVVLTSNLASEELVSLYESHEGRPDPEAVIDRIRPMLSRHFQPALLNRMTIVPFGPIGTESLEAIADMELGALAARVQEAHGTTLHVGDEVRAELARRCVHVDAGAREIKALVHRTLLPRVARELLARMTEGRAPAEVRVGLVDGEITVGVDDEQEGRACA